MEITTPRNAYFLVFSALIITAADALGALKQNQLSIDRSSTPVPTRTKPYQHQQHISIHPRTALPSTVDFGSLPTCAFTECIYPATATTPIPCSSISTPCPSGVNTECWTFDRSCFCNLAKPLECAFHPCPWLDVILMENWFNKTCPETNPSITYSFQVDSAEIHVPSCARDCIHKQTIRYGCTSESKNCFCSHASLYGCTATCDQAENSTIASWFKETCQTTLESATNTVAGDNSGAWDPKGGGPSPPRRPRPLRWYEKFGIAVFSITAGLLCIFAMEREWRDKCAYFVGPHFSNKFPRYSQLARQLGIKPAMDPPIQA